MTERIAGRAGIRADRRPRGATDPRPRGNGNPRPRGKVDPRPLGQPLPATLATTSGKLGWLPELAFTAAAGIVTVAAAFILAAAGSGLADPLFWAAFLVIGLPIVIRLAMAAPHRNERVALVVLLALALQVVRLVRSPAAFTSYDELLHLRTLADVLGTGHLFAPNPLLPVSPDFPGMEIVTAGVVQLGDAGAFAAGSVVIAALHIVLVLGLFALYAHASGSARVAGLATAIYAFGPNFTFFDGQFAYESFALPLLAALLLAVALRARGGHRRWPTVAIALLAVAIVASHHITTVAAIGLLVGWTLVRLVMGRADRYSVRPIAATAGGLAVLAVVWVTTIAPDTLAYLGAPLQTAIGEIVRFITEGESRPLFESTTGQAASIPERVVGLGAAGLLLLSIPIGAWVVFTRHRHSLAVLLAVLALGYPASLIGRLMPTASQAAGRSLTFVFIGLAFVTALSVVALLELPARRNEVPRRLRRQVERLASSRRGPPAVRTVLAAAAALVIVGGVVVGSAPAARFPGPHLVSADARSVDDLGISAATWARRVLGPGQAFAADRVNRVLLGAYGGQDILYHGSRLRSTWQVFVSAGVGQSEIDRLRLTSLQYLLIDRRLSTSLPLIPYYYEEGETFLGRHTVPISPAVLGKWDATPNVDRLYDNGSIQVYGVAGLYGPRPTPVGAVTVPTTPPPALAAMGEQPAVAVFQLFLDLARAIAGLVVLALPAVAVALGLRSSLGRGRRPEPALLAAVGVAIVVIGGLVLSALPTGLGRWPWLGLGLGLLLSLFLVRDRFPRIRVPRPGSVAVSLGIAALLALAGVAAARVAVHGPVEQFTQLWMTPTDQAGGTLAIGIENDEGEASTYRIELLLEDRRLAEWRAISLESGQSWSVTFAADVPAGTAVRAFVYREGAGADPYRETVVWGPLGAAGPVTTD